MEAQAETPNRGYRPQITPGKGGFCPIRGVMRARGSWRSGGSCIEQLDFVDDALRHHLVDLWTAVLNRPRRFLVAALKSPENVAQGSAETRTQRHVVHRRLTFWRARFFAD
ncbi:MAG: hypothetical protein CM1200mP36_08340 [Gammaproteobacteria bacterium]|nr:MAG: hypothetical protein CM1200mP36_08340 [Gammaproteobacteria bacterium]